MPSPRKFYKTTYKIEILSEDLLGDALSLEQINYLITEGECSGVVEEEVYETLTSVQAAQELVKQGSDPSFFGLTEAGEDSE